MKKSNGVGFILTLLFGPLGLFYSNAVAVIAVLLIVAPLISFGGSDAEIIALFGAWALSIILSFVSVDSHNAVVETEERRHEEILAAIRGKNLENL